MREGQTIYVVIGTRGEYSDRSEWPVCAFTDEAAAQAFAERCEREIRDAATSFNNRRSWTDYDAEEAEAKRINATLPDPDIGVSDYGAQDATYGVAAIPIGEPRRESPSR